jgi:hypothetical protein
MVAATRGTLAAGTMPRRQRPLSANSASSPGGLPPALIPSSVAVTISYGRLGTVGAKPMGCGARR